LGPGAAPSSARSAPGPRLGAILKSLEKEWIASGFTLDRGALIERAVKALEA
ncbi:CCA tRNA nucleotidyltransferase, partial [bacterium M00.F.Ca.ET.180.01.1.1]